jgi:hypothetical protein
MTDESVKTPTRIYKWAEYALLGLVSVLLLLFLSIFVIAVVRATNPGPRIAISTSDYRSVGTVRSARTPPVKTPGGPVAPVTTSMKFEYDFTKNNVLSADSNKLTFTNLTKQVYDQMLSFSENPDVFIANNPSMDSVSITFDNGIYIKHELDNLVASVSNFDNIIYTLDSGSFSGVLRFDASMKQEVAFVFGNGMSSIGRSRGIDELFAITFVRNDSTSSLLLKVHGQEAVVKTLSGTIPDLIELRFAVDKSVMTVKVFEATKNSILTTITSPYSIEATIIDSIISETKIESRLQFISLTSTTTTTPDTSVKVLSKDLKAFDAFGDQLTITNNIIPTESTVICQLPKTIIPNLPRFYKDADGKNWHVADVVKLTVEVEMHLESPMYMYMFKYLDVDAFESLQSLMPNGPYLTGVSISEMSLNRFATLPMQYTEAGSDTSKSSITETSVLTFDLCKNIAMSQHNGITYSIKDGALIKPFNYVLLGGLGGSLIKKITVEKYLQKVLVK